MRLNVDEKVFEEQQVLLVRELVQNISVKLREAGLDGKKLEEATAGIAFSVVSVIDDNAGIEVEGTEVHPYLTFRTGDDELTHCGENAYLHEFVYEVLQSLYGS
jgi:intein/homing endonuclease